MRLFRLAVAILSFVLAPVVSPAASPAVPTITAPSNAAIQRLLEARIANAPGTGIIVGILDHGATSILESGSSGTARPLDEDSLFEIGSVTKTFTATLLAAMAGDDEVRLDDPVQRCLPPGTTVPERDGKAITLLSLATQHSGLPRMPDNLQPRDAQDPYADYTFAQLSAFLEGYTLTRDPGAVFEYSNLGVGLLGDALADCAHTSYERLLATRVFAPLGMTETSAQPITALSARERALLTVGHSANGITAQPWSFRALAPAGAIRSNVRDMLRFVRCNLGLGPLAAACLSAQEPRSTLPGNRIGLIWWTGDLIPIVHHGGDTYGFHAAVAIAPNHRRGVVVLANGGESVDSLAEHLIDTEIPAPSFARTSSLRKTVALPAEQLDAYAGGATVRCCSSTGSPGRRSTRARRTIFSTTWSMRSWTSRETRRARSTAWCCTRTGRRSSPATG